MRLRRNRLAVLVLITVMVVHMMAIPVLAADMDKLNQELDRQQEKTADKPNLALEFVKLLLVLALIVGAAWSVIRLFSRQVASKMQGTWLHVVDEVALGQNRGILLCEVGERIFAVGVTDHNISLLFEVTHPKLLEEISQGWENDSSASRSLDLPSGLGQQLWQRFRGMKGGVPGHSQRQNFHSLMEEQVKRIESLSSINTGGSQNNARNNSQS